MIINLRNLPQKSDLAHRCLHDSLYSMVWKVKLQWVLPGAFAKCSGADKGIEVMQVGWKKSSESSGGELLPIG